MREHRFLRERPDRVITLTKGGQGITVYATAAIALIVALFVLVVVVSCILRLRRCCAKNMEESSTGTDKEGTGKDDSTTKSLQKEVKDSEYIRKTLRFSSSYVRQLLDSKQPAMVPLRRDSPTDDEASTNTSLSDSQTL